MYLQHDLEALKFDLRRAAEVRNAAGAGTGELNRALYQRWIEAHSDALAALPPEVRQPLLERFEDVSIEIAPVRFNSPFAFAGGQGDRSFPGAVRLLS